MIFLQRTKVAHKDAEDPTSPPPAQQYHSNPNQPSTSYLAPLYIQSQNPLTTPDEVLGGACPTTHASSFELASSSMLNFNREHVNAVAGGGFGDIYRGELRNGTAVAIKTLRHHMLAQDTAPKALKRAAREIYTWSKAQHKNVQELLGVIMFQGQLGMVSPWMDNGNLEEYIRKNPDVDRHDLRNVLVDKGGIARLSDFDHSILTNCTLLFTETTNVGGGTLRWMAPELLLSSGEDDAAPVTRSKQTDIYALGMTMLVGFQVRWQPRPLLNRHRKLSREEYRTSNTRSIEALFGL
ncbi:hypothetical protein FRC10_003578 [Ceratobasidium sp. 414]|nr:hypothetical protein FRC10_003578 [Ceratobasidium sp. 414]